MATLYGDSTNHWRAYANYSTADSNTTTTVTVSGAGMESVDWGFELSGSVVSTTVTLTGKSSLSGAGSFYSDWGTTVQTSYASGSWSITRTTSAQTVTLGVTTVNASGYMDGTSSGSTTITVPALQSYTVKYDANGGSGAPASQTKYYGQSITLSTTKPTRTGYNFLGWNTSSTATSANTNYDPGKTYSTEANLTLYAVWTQDYVRPTVKIGRIWRCNSSGTTQSDGTYAAMNATWSTNSGSNATNLTIEYRRSTSSSWTSAWSTNPNASSGTISVSTTGALGGGNLNASYTYVFRLTVTDSGGSSSYTITLPPETVMFDFSGQYGQVGLGRLAPTDYANMLDSSYTLRSHVNFQYQDDSMTVGTAPSSARASGAYFVTDSKSTIVGGMTDYQSSADYTGIAFLAERTVSSTTYDCGFVMAITPSGSFRVVAQNNASAVAFADGFYVLQPRQLYWTTSGTTGTVTLSSSAANFDRLEILYHYDSIYATQWVALGSSTSGATVNLMLMYPDSSDPTVCWIKTRLVRISGTSITTVRAANYQAGSAQGCQNTDSEIAIVRVLGYTTGGISV